MGDHFWSVEPHLPEGSGYEMLGAGHLTLLLILFSVIVLMVILFRRSSEETRSQILKTVSVMLPALEVFKIAFLIVSGNMGMGYLPLHFCSVPIILYPVIAFSDNRHLREILMEISLCTFLPAAVLTLIFPDWTMYPMLSFMNIYAYLWHTLLVMFPVLGMIHWQIRPRIRHFWWNTAFLLAAGIPVYIFDKVFSCNYWFLLRPVRGTPLQILAEPFGGRAYIPLLLITASLVNLICYGIFAIVFCSPGKK